MPLALIGGVQAWHGRAQLNWVAPVMIGATLAVALALRAERPGRGLRGWSVALALQPVLLAGITLATDVAQIAPRPLPRRLVITSVDKEEAPQYFATMMWDLTANTDDANFVFTPPKDAKSIPWNKSTYAAAQKAP